METKLSKLLALMDAGDWDAALSFANKFPRLGAAEVRVRRAAAAALSPGLYRGMGFDPAALREGGITALRARYATGLRRGPATT